MKQDIDRWKLQQQIFEEAYDLPRAQRHAFLKERCGEDLDLIKEVDNLLCQSEESDPPPIVDLLHYKDRQPKVGDRLDGYRLLSQLGNGGMGYVYLATADDDTKVAIKVIRSTLLTDSLIRRFQRERAIMGGLNHPYIAKILDHGMDAQHQRPYIVMEYVEGIPIDAWVQEQKLTLLERLHLFKQLCDGVLYLHQRTVIHCDLKPSNILVTPDGKIKILDFGISRYLEQDDDHTNWEARPLSRNYASPEQVLGEPLNSSSDIYSLGVIFYQIVTSHLPYDFKDNSQREILKKWNSKPEQPKTFLYKEDADSIRLEDLDHCVMKAIALEPRDRYENISQLKDDLNFVLEGLPLLTSSRYQVYFANIIRNQALKIALAICGLVLVFMTYTTYLVQHSQLVSEKQRAENWHQFATLSLEVMTREDVHKLEAKVRDQFREQPESLAWALHQLVQFYEELGASDHALRLRQERQDLGLDTEKE